MTHNLTKWATVYISQAAPIIDKFIGKTGLNVDGSGKAGAGGPQINKATFNFLTNPGKPGEKSYYTATSFSKENSVTSHWKDETTVRTEV